MPRNVEIKAKVNDINKIKKLAEAITAAPPEVLVQRDTFYQVSSGRLKLREFESGSASQLIFYDRPDAEGAKISDYCIYNSVNPQQLNTVLKCALGEIGVVQKTRFLYIYDKTRIHVDEVAGLGNFMELEVVLTDDQSLHDGQLIAKDLMLKLGIRESDLISGAYLDQLINK